MKIRSRVLLGAGLAGLLFTGLARAQLSVSSGIPIGYGTITSNYTPSGLENAFSIEAQPFQTPDSTHVQLTDFTFYYVPNAGFPSNYLTAAIVEWNPTTFSSLGAPLWTSSVGTTTTGSFSTPTPTNPYGGTAWNTYQFSTGGVDLDPAKTYAWVLIQNSTANSGDNESGSYAFSSQIGGANFGGRSFVSSTPWTWLDASNATWGNTVNALAYSANFSAAAVPEPAADTAIAGAVVLALAVGPRLKRRSPKAAEAPVAQ